MPVSGVRRSAPVKHKRPHPRLGIAQSQAFTSHWAQTNPRVQPSRDTWYSNGTAVSVAQLVEHRSVAPRVAGSTPVAHPNSQLTAVAVGSARFVRQRTDGRGSFHAHSELSD